MEEYGLKPSPTGRVLSLVVDTGLHGEIVREDILAEVPEDKRRYLGQTYFELTEFAPPGTSEANLFGSVGLVSLLTKSEFLPTLGGEVTITPEVGAVSFQDESSEIPAIITLAGGVTINPLDGYDNIFGELREQVNDQITYHNLSEHRQEILNYLQTNRPEAFAQYLIYRDLAEIVKERGNAVIVQAATANHDALDPAALVPKEAPFIHVISTDVALTYAAFERTKSDYIKFPDWTEGYTPTELGYNSFSASGFSGELLDALINKYLMTKQERREAKSKFSGEIKQD